MAMVQCAHSSLTIIKTYILCNKKAFPPLSFQVIYTANSTEHYPKSWVANKSPIINSLNIANTRRSNRLSSPLKLLLYIARHNRFELALLRNSMIEIGAFVSEAVDFF